MSLHGTIRDGALHPQAGLDTPRLAPTDRQKTSRRLPAAKGFGSVSPHWLASYCCGGQSRHYS